MLRAAVGAGDGTGTAGATAGLDGCAMLCVGLGAAGLPLAVWAGTPVF